jgi:pimeloyl-ACP methyl ester carboxylesterase
MAQMETRTIDVNTGGYERTIAVRHRPATGDLPALMWLGGFKSDMEGSKALAIDEYAESTGSACIRFDYSGHGASSAEFEDGTISRWLEEAEAVFDQTARGPTILIGSSMGGWIALLLAKRIIKKSPDLLHALILLAPAADMTQDLMWGHFSEVQRTEIVSNGRLELPSEYSDAPNIITHQLIEDGRQHLLGNAILSFGRPIWILQGAADSDVPWQHAAKLMNCLVDDSVLLTIIKDGDHRLSRPKDLERLLKIVQEAQQSSPAA